MISIQSHGEDLFQVGNASFDIRPRSPHKMEVAWIAPARDTFAVGDAAPDYANMRIISLQTTQDGNAWMHNLDCEGILDSRTFLELDAPERQPETGFDELQLEIYTREPTDARWLKGERRLTGSILTGVTGEADDDLLTKSAHGLTTGQAVVPTFASGFTGLTSGTGYIACVISSSTLKLALNAALAAAGSVSNNGTAFAITGTASTSKINATAHGLSNGTVVTFPTLTGGAGITAITVPYYVVNTATNDFEVSLTSGGSAVAFNTNITAGTCRTGSTINITADGTGMTLTPVMVGYENLYLTDSAQIPITADGVALDYSVLQLSYKGMRRTKLRKRTIGVSAGVYSDDAFPTLIDSPVWYNYPPEYLTNASFGPVSGTQFAEIDLPNITVTDDFISLTPPPTTLVPGYWTPASAPSVNDIAGSLSDGAAAVTHHYPGGWKCTSMQSEQILDKDVYHLVITWTYQSPRTPRSAA